MSTDQSSTKDDLRAVGSTLGKWAAIAGVVLIVALVLAALLPRWWAQQIGDLVDGRISYGSALGVVVGFAFTFLPLLTLMQAWRSRARSGLALGFLALTVALALPNLMTLWVALGAGSSAHAGQRILDVNGPGFRGGSVVGAVVGAAIMSYIAWLQLSRDRRKRKILQEKERQQQIIRDMAAEE